MLEPVSRSRCLGCHVTAVVRVDRRLKRHPADNFDASLCETIELGGIVGEQGYSCATQHSQHARGDAVIAFIIVKSERGIGIEGVETIILQLICPHLVCETNSAALLRQIENDAASELLEACKSKPKLVAAVAAPRSEHVACQAGGMQPYRNRIGEISIANYYGHQTPTHGIADHVKASGCARAERHRGFAGY